MRHRLDESNFVLVPKGTQLYVGTPHHYFSIYADAPRKEADEDAVFLDGFKRFFLPILNEKKESVWPENFSKDDINLLAKQSGPQKFASQMMLQPVNVVESRLNTQLLNFYSDSLAYYEANKKASLSIGQEKIISCSTWWDPAFGSAKGDSSVLAILFTDAQGTHYLHHLSYITLDGEDEIDEATAQCRIVASKLQEFYVPSVTIETNGIGKFLSAILRRELSKDRIACSVVEHSSTMPKNQRILEAFDAILAAEKLNLHDDIRKTPFVREMMDWNPASNKNKDDGLDSVAGALSQEPIRIKRFYTNATKKWAPNAFIHTANTNFDI